MLHPYTYLDYPKERQKELLKLAGVNLTSQANGSRQGNRIGLINRFMSKVESVLVSAGERLSERLVSPAAGKVKEA